MPPILYFHKSKRAQSDSDFETWIAGGVAPTLNRMDNTGDSRATVLIFYGNRVDDIRFQGDVINTLQARMGTGGGNMPIMFSHTQGLDPQPSEDNSPTLRSGGNGMAVAIQGNMIGRADTAGPQGKGFTEEGEPMYTLTKTDVHAVVGTLQARDYKGLNHEGVRDGKAIVEGSVVRRLTPVECERLQGFPDNWTEGQADTHRYKQMGNAVAVPVVQWIVARMTDANL